MTRIPLKKYLSKSNMPLLLTKDDIFMYHVNRESEALEDIVMPPVPPYEKQSMTFTETAKSAFGYLIGSLSV